MTEHEKHIIAKTVGFIILGKQNVVYQYSNKSYPYDHEMWLLYMGLIESSQFQKS